jgi:hypothetical protein
MEYSHYNRLLQRPLYDHYNDVLWKSLYSLFHWLVQRPL